ncbi:cytochrome b [Marinimicrobium sp. ARAG 43.8]|uniref:cytochrome b n=1 Tax=Marinimicrobium sp. ARAG 43.8 TaxID=3418719 RepID=UPI003CEECA11
MLSDDHSRYGWVTISLHWISAITVIGLFGLGIYMVDLTYYDKGYHELPRLHVSIGLLFGGLMALRVLWRIAQRGNPRALPNHGTLVRFAASTMKYALYALIFLMIATGYLIHTAKGDPAWVFEWFSIPSTWQLGADGVDLAGDIHRLAGWAIIVLAAAHAGAAFWHHGVIRDRTLKRMLRPGPPETDNR